MTRSLPSRAPGRTRFLAALLLGFGASSLGAPGLGAQAPVLPAPPRDIVPDTGALSIERVFRGHDFDNAAFPEPKWLASGDAWLELRAGDVVRVDARSGRATVVVPAARLAADGKALDVDDLQVSPDGALLLLQTGTRPTVPHKTGSIYFVYDVARARLVPVSRAPGLQLTAKLSPDGRRVGFARDNDLWVTDLATGAERRLTSGGSDTILNGVSDWVYHEELDLADAWRWSPDGGRIAFWRFDQSGVPVYPMVNWLPPYPTIFPLRHPYAGNANAKVTIGVIDVDGGESVPAPRWLDIGAYEYVARVDWLGTDSLVVETLPRAQDRVDLLVASAATGKSRPLFSERDSAWVDAEPATWVNDGKQFLWFSDRSGWRQLYLVDRRGSIVRRVTNDGVDVAALAGVAGGDVYVQVAEPNPNERRVWRFRMADGKGERLTSTPGAHDLALAPRGRLAIGTRSRLGTPPTMELLSLPDGRVVRTIADNAALLKTMADAGVRQPEFFRVPVPDGTQLDAYRITPAGFDSTRKYPVLMYVYGGPSAPTVADAWGDKRYFFHQLLARRGYVVVSVDNRGAALRGRAFRKVIARHLGTHESQDQIDAAKWIGARPWGDARRIGMWGRSYGGFMTALCTTKGGDVFRAGMAIVPVTDWRFYDTIYTERYMRTPQENEAGYDETAPLSHADGLTARLLLLTSTGDDNVHAQNTLSLADRLTQANKPFTMMEYVNRPHPLTGGNTRAHWYGTMYRFVLEQL